MFCEHIRSSHNALVWGEWVHKERVLQIKVGPTDATSQRNMRVCFLPGVKAGDTWTNHSAQLIVSLHPESGVSQILILMIVKVVLVTVKAEEKSRCFVSQVKEFGFILQEM